MVKRSNGRHRARRRVFWDGVLVGEATMLAMVGLAVLLLHLWP